MTKRLRALLLALLIPLCALAEEAPTPLPQARWRAIAQSIVTIRKEPSLEAEAVGAYDKGDRVMIAAYEPAWLEVVKGEIAGWIPRQTVDDHESLSNAWLPFGAMPAEYVAQIGEDCPLRAAPDEDADALAMLTAGERVALVEIQDGWGKLIRWRQYGYVRLDSRVASLEPVFTPDEAGAGDLIAAYCSFYALSGRLVPNRLHNIAMGCEHISVVLEPGEMFDFNKIAGPYGPSMGYYKAMSYFEGEAVPSYGGGTCQVSSTLYNTLLPFSGRGIDIVYRRAHGPSGATYLPHGVDAAVGSDSLDFIFRNAFEFAVRIDAHSNGNGILFIALTKEGTQKK